MVHRIETVTVETSPMEVVVFESAASGRHPAIILAQQVPIAHTGLEKDPFTLTTGERYAQAGYVVAAPFIFHWWPKDEDLEVKRRESRDDRTALDLEAAYDLLAAHPKVDADRIGIVGHCWGGRVSWLGACHNPNLKACAIFYGGRIKQALGEGNPPAIELAGNIKCPVIGFFGNEDSNPSPDDVDDYDAALTAAGVPHTFHRYDGAGHAFQAFTNDERYRPEASEDAWAKVLAFLGGTLGRG